MTRISRDSILWRLREMSIPRAIPIFCSAAYSADHPSHTLRSTSVAKLLAPGEPVYFKLQNISEFWNVGRRGPRRTTALDSPFRWFWVRSRRSSDFSRSCRTHRGLRGMEAPGCLEHGVLGSKVHDAKLVATMNVHGIRRILTFNTEDFTSLPTSRRFTLCRCDHERSDGASCGCPTL